MNIAVTNRKGGVGKSTIALHLATGLAIMGYRVALVDTDSQGHVSLSLNLARTDGLYRALVEKADIQSVIVPVSESAYSTEKRPSKGGLFILPAEDKTSQIAGEIKDDPFTFLSFLDQMKQELKLHIVVIDTSPTIKDLDAQVFLATDAYLYVTEAEALSIDGVKKAIEQNTRTAANRAQHLNRQTRVLGILPNKVRNTDSHTYHLELMETMFGERVMKPVALRTLWSEASLMQETLYTFADTSKSAQDAWRVVNHVISEIKAWQSGG